MRVQQTTKGRFLPGGERRTRTPQSLVQRGRGRSCLALSSVVRWILACCQARRPAPPVWSPHRCTTRAEHLRRRLNRTSRRPTMTAGRPSRPRTWTTSTVRKSAWTCSISSRTSSGERSPWPSSRRYFPEAAPRSRDLSRGPPLAYMPQPVHSGAAYSAPTQSHDAPPIKEEPPEPQDFRRAAACAQFSGPYGPNPPNPGGAYGGFAPLPPLGGPLLPPMLKHKPPPPRRSSGKAIDKGTDEYRRRRERNNIAVRKSREKAKVRSREVEEKVKTLLREKEALLKRLEAVSGELSLHKQMYVHLINLNHPEITELCRSMLQLGASHGPDHSL